MNHTIDTNRVTLNDKANLGTINRLPRDARLSDWVELALNRNFNVDDLIMDKWEVPAGAFKETLGTSLIQISQMRRVFCYEMYVLCAGRRFKKLYIMGKKFILILNVLKLTRIII